MYIKCNNTSNAPDPKLILEMIKRRENKTMRKFQSIIFYENKENLDHYLRLFCDEKPIRTVNDRDENYIEYEHFTIRLFNKIPNDTMRGFKCDLVAVESSLYNSYGFKNAYPVLCGMLAVSRFDLKFQVF